MRAADEKSESVRRVAAAAQAVGLMIEIRRMPASTRTAAEAAAACGVTVAQIVKSLVFAGAETDRLALFLVSGAHSLDETAAAAALGEPLVRADAKRVRAETGFAIGGVAPLGHLTPLETFVDAALLDYDVVWAAAGAPNAVFSVAPRALLASVGGLAHPLGPPGPG